MKITIFAFIFAVLIAALATAQFPSDQKRSSATQGSLAWHRQVEQQHRQHRFFEQLQGRAIRQQHIEELRRLRDHQE